MRLASKQGLVVLRAWSEPAIGVIDDHNDDGGQRDDGDDDHMLGRARVAQIVGLSRNMTSFRIIFSESVCSTFATKSAVF